MRRYYFRAEYKGIMVTDDEGEELPSLHAAKAHAAKVAAELSGNTSVRVKVLVLSEEGAVLATEPAGQGRLS
jgi:hypothetical protein